MRTVIAITGGSGIAYAVKLLETIPGERVLVASETAKRIIEHECGTSFDEIASRADVVLEDGDMFAAIASGSYPFDAMVVVPCTESTLAKIAAGVADTLITRAAAVTLKEGRRLVLVPRETPLSPIMLENMLRLSRCGDTILPACPGFYHHPQEISDLVDFVVARILDQLGVEQKLVPRWGQ